MSNRIGVWTDSSVCFFGFRHLLLKVPAVQLVWIHNGTDLPEQSMLSVNALLCTLSLSSPLLLDKLAQLKKLHGQMPRSVLVFNQKLGLDETEDFMKYGVIGFIHSGITQERFLGAIDGVLAGNYYFDDQATEMNVREMIKALVEKKANRPKDENHLTTREREVLKMLAEGDSLKEIANKLNLSAKTVEAHKFRIYKKLGIHNKAHLVAYAIQAKIIRLPAMDEGRPELDRLTVPAVG